MAALILTTLLLVSGVHASTKPTRFTLINNSGTSIRGTVWASKEVFVLHHGHSFTTKGSHDSAADVDIMLARACPGMGRGPGNEATAWRDVLNVLATNPWVGDPFITVGGLQFGLSENQEVACNTYRPRTEATCRRNRDSDAKELVATLHNMPRACGDGEPCMNDWRYV